MSVAAGVVAAFSVLGINLTPLLTFGGASGIVAGFASQQLLLNAVSGFSLFLTRPFIQVGTCCRAAAITTSISSSSNVLFLFIFVLLIFIAWIDNDVSGALHSK